MSALTDKVLQSTYAQNLQTREERTLALAALMMVILTLFPACQKTKFAQPQPAQMAVEIPSTQTFFMRASGTGREFQIFIAHPTGPAPEGGFATIYMTDANVRFGTMTEAARSHERSHPDEGVGAIIVGIGYPIDTNIGKQRGLDLTHSLDEKIKTPEGFGGAQQFLEFLQDDLRPEIERRYAVAPDKQAIFGHSFGGLFALYAMSQTPQAFQTYLLSSPSVWWGKRDILNHLNSTLDAFDEEPISLRVLITVGSEEQGGAPPARGPTNLPGFSTMTQVDDAKALNEKLIRTKGIHSELVIFNDENHGSVPPAAMSRSITYMFEKF